MVKDVMNFITQSDPEVGKAIEAEYARQKRNIELIASENIVSEAVMMAMGTVLTNKMSLKISPSKERKNCLAPTMPAYSLIPAQAPTWLFTLH